MAIKRIEAIYKFLQAARNLVKNKAMTKEQILDFAKREFGEIDDFFKLQIDNLFRKPKVISPVKEAYKKELKRLEGALGSLDSKQPGFTKAANELIAKITKLQRDYKTGKFVPKEKADVIPIRQKEGIETLSEADEDIANIQKTMDDLDETMKEADAFSESIGFPKNPYRPGGALDPVTGVTRTLARRILEKKGIEIGKKDPLEVFENTIGFDVLTDVKNLADDIVDAEKQGRNLKSMDELLEIEGLFNVKISDNPVKGMPHEEFVKMVDKIESEKLIDKVGKEFQLDVEKFAKEFSVSKEEALRISKLPAKEQQTILQKYIDEDLKQRIELADFDVTGRDPNAHGGIIGSLRLNRMGFDSGGTSLQRLKQMIVDDMMSKTGVSEDKLQLIVKDITLDMNPDQIQASIVENFKKNFGSYATGGRVQASSGGLINILKL